MLPVLISIMLKHLSLETLSTVWIKQRDHSVDYFQGQMWLTILRSIYKSSLVIDGPAFKAIVYFHLKCFQYEWPCQSWSPIVLLFCHQKRLQACHRLGSISHSWSCLKEIIEWQIIKLNKMLKAPISDILFESGGGFFTWMDMLSKVLTIFDSRLSKILIFLHQYHLMPANFHCSGKRQSRMWCLEES